MGESDPVDKHLAKAFASLDDLSVRELEATADEIAGRRHPLHDFSSIFRNVANAREGLGLEPPPLASTEEH